VGILASKPIVKRYVRKLTPDQVLAMRARYAQGDVGFEELAEGAGVATNTIRRAVTGQTWQYLPGAVPSRPSGVQLHHYAKLTAGQVHEIREATGLQRAIATRYGISQAVVSRIKNGKAWVEPPPP
jgi:hypothetical protein